MAPATSNAPIQFAVPLSEVLKLAQQGLMSLALAAFTQVAEHLMSWEVEEVVGAKNQPQPERDKVRWGKQAGYCVVGGQKVPLQRPRVRDVRQREVPLGSYEMLQRRFVDGGSGLAEDHARLDDATLQRCNPGDGASLRNREVHSQ